MGVYEFLCQIWIICLHPQLLELVSGKDDGYVGLPHAEFTESRTALDAVGDRAINIAVINPTF